MVGHVHFIIGKQNNEEDSISNTSDAISSRLIQSTDWQAPSNIYVISRMRRYSIYLFSHASNVRRYFDRLLHEILLTASCSLSNVECNIVRGPTLFLYVTTLTTTHTQHVMLTFSLSSFPVSVVCFSPI